MYPDNGWCGVEYTQIMHCLKMKTDDYQCCVRYLIMNNNIDVSLIWLGLIIGLLDYKAIKNDEKPYRICFFYSTTIELITSELG